LKKRSKSEFHSRILSFDRNKKGKGGKIPLNPKTTYILRIQALSLFPEKYAQILNMSEKELNTDLQEIL
jgi:hypothetical protein